MIGGKLLAEGGYGCVFMPGINCDGSIMETKKYTSKIQRFDSSAKNEIKIGKIVQELNGFGHHFAPVIKFCELNVAKIKDDDKNKCTIFKKNKSKTFVVMKLLYIDGDDFLDYLINQKNSVQLVSNIIISFNHLCHSLGMLAMKDIVHYDIKGANIIFDKKKEIPILIDFGLSVNMNNIIVDNITIDKLKEMFYVYAPDYYVWSLEIHYMCYLVNKNKEPTIEELEEISRKYVEGNKALQRNFSPTFLKRYEVKCINQLTKYNNTPFDERVTLILGYWKTFDNYSVSIMYLKFINYININGFIDNEFILFFTKLLLKNIDPNPERRLTLTTTTQTFNKFLYQKQGNNIQTFEQLSESFIENRDILNNEIVKDKKKGLYQSKTMRAQRRKSITN
jgi:tRNA A-37 threonylcarbamoyl transferase component Bud32